MIKICYKCDLIGHIEELAKMKKNVSLAVSPDRVEKGKCNANKRCINCQDDHVTLDRSCPKIMRHTAIIKTMALENISFAEARRKIDNLPKHNAEENCYLIKTSGSYPSLPSRGNIQGFNKVNSKSYASRVSSPMRNIHPSSQKGLLSIQQKFQELLIRFSTR